MINLTKLILKSKFFIKRLININYLLSLKLIFMNDVILCNWYEHPEGNFGDDLNPWMLERMTGKTIINSNNIINFKINNEFSFIGSILGEYPQRKMIIMGSGLISQDNPVKYKKESKFLFVRGPLSRKMLVEKGYYCPEIYCDPALLLPLIYVPTNLEKKYKLGVIPHYVDKDHPFIVKLKNHDDCKFIDIQGGIEKTIIDINSCEFIVSSSLHGLIVADAYGIPSKWIEFSDKVIGNGFKFRDYFLSVGRNQMKSYQVNPRSCFNDLIELFLLKENIKIDYGLILSQLPSEFDFYRYNQKAKVI